MKKIILSAAIASVLVLSSCGGHSGATGEQIDKAKEEAKEMLEQTKKAPAQSQPDKQALPQAEAAPADTMPK